LMWDIVETKIRNRVCLLVSSFISIYSQRSCKVSSQCVCGLRIHGPDKWGTTM
jgi:hypothetical protein